MKNNLLLILIFFVQYESFGQKLLTSWSQQNIENYTEEMYNEAQKLTSSELLSKNLKDNSWSAVFLTLNSSLNNFSKDKKFLKELANQITNNKETKLEGTSRLIIWDRILTGEILFEGKGLVIENDLYKVSGRANQLLQNLTNKNFGYVKINTTKKELEELKKKWITFLSDIPVEEYKSTELKNSPIPEISSLTAIQALIFSLKDNPKKQLIIKKCLKNIYQLDEMPKEKGSLAENCNPDHYTLAYLGILFGDSKNDENKDIIWWENFWQKNYDKITWNNEKGIFELKQ